MDVLLKGDQPIGSYYMRAKVYQGSDLTAFSRQNPYRDERLFITIGLGLLPCEGQGNATCLGPNGQRIAACMKNRSFEPSTKLSILEAFYYNVSAIYTTDFPDEPPVKFDYSNEANTSSFALLPSVRSHSVRQLKIILLWRSSVENHPMHFHGHDVHVLAQGYGNYDPASARLNLVNPQLMNTVPVPLGGWAVIRFRAN